MLVLRLALLFVIGYIIFLALKSLIFGAKAKAGEAAKIGEPMVLDPQCQIYLPRAEALERRGNFFCSEECAQKYLAR
jgi:hypothetical protein